MPRSIVIATCGKLAWGSHGTWAMLPDDSLEGLGNWATRISDRVAFLHMQNADTFFVSGMNYELDQAQGTYFQLTSFRAWYSGWHPQLFIAFKLYHGGMPLGYPAYISIRFGNVDLGTQYYSVPNVLKAEWLFDMPPDLSAREATFKIYGRRDQFPITMAELSMTWLPTKFDDVGF